MTGGLIVGVMRVVTIMMLPRPYDQLIASNLTPDASKQT
jgi:hypothetical protein